MDVDGERFDHALEAKKEARGAKQDTDLSADDLRELVDDVQGHRPRGHRPRVPDGPVRAARPRDQGRVRQLVRQARPRLPASQKIADDLGTAVNVVTMVFGNMGDDSGTGVAFTRDPNTGENVLFGEYLHERPGRGRRRRHPDRPEDRPDGDRHAGRSTTSSCDIGQQLENHYRDVQDLEFTIEKGRLYMLQTRSAKRTAAAAVKIAVDMVERGDDLEGGGGRPDRAGARRPAPARDVRRRRRSRAPRRSSTASTPRRARRSGGPCSTPTTPSSGSNRGEKVILVRIETSPDDFHGMAVAEGIITARGGATSHAAVVARQIGKPCVAGLGGPAGRLRRQAGARAASPGPSSRRATGSSLDGSTGALYLGALPTVEARFEDQPELQTILGWADAIRRMGVWTNADKPEEAAQARGYGAQGIGLCRTEHMFREGDRLEIVRGAILVAQAATRAKAQGRRRVELLDRTSSEDVATFDAAMGKLEKLQQGDFEGIFRAMDGLPVVIRLIDPPLHEFLPNLEEQLVKVTKAEEHGGASDEDKELLATIKGAPRAEPDARAPRLPPRADVPGLREDPDPGDPQRPDRGQEGGRQPDRQDHDPARRPRERAGGDAGAARDRGEGGPGGKPAASRSTTSSGR